MPILRAGPFGDFAAPDYFVGPDVSDSSVLPISCADDFNNPTWPWLYRYRFAGAGNTEYRSGEPGSSTETNNRLFEYAFLYQAAQPFSLDYFASAEAVSSQTAFSSELNARLFVDTLGEVDSDTFFGPWDGLNEVSISGSVSLPAAVIPSRVSLTGSIFNTASSFVNTRSITLSITKSS
jgi:hypothetical protein